ncbi:MAG TPA: ABC transporter substrate-binding protein, partial [Acidimicrobiales bacterium]|nr:ABC transporter substrate-binding protein [Acidimicrobiales bacterium]
PGVPDVHNALALDAQKEPNNFSSQPIRQGSALGPIDYFKSKAPDAITSAASLIGDVQSAKDAWIGERAAMVHEGYQFTYERIYEPTETDFTADIVQMRAKGVKLLILIAADVKSIARIESKAAEQNFHPEITALGASAYDPLLIPLAGARALEGAYLYLPTAMYLGEDRGSNQEVDLFLTWLKKTHPNANPDLFTAYGWGSARLFVQALQAAGQANGGKATRAGVIAALKNVHKFDSNGLMAVADPAAKAPPTCYVIVRVQGGKFVRVDDPPGAFRCDGQYFFAGG